MQGQRVLELGAGTGTHIVTLFSTFITSTKVPILTQRPRAVKLGAGTCTQFATQFTCITSTKVQTLTQKLSVAQLAAGTGTQFTTDCFCITSTKVQIPTQITGTRQHTSAFVCRRMLTHAGLYSLVQAQALNFLAFLAQKYKY